MRAHLGKLDMTDLDGVLRRLLMKTLPVGDQEIVATEQT